MDDMDRLIEAVEMVGRMGAQSFQVGYLVDNPAPGVANWWCSADFRSGTLVTLPAMTPEQAAEDLVAMLRRDARCAWCGRRVSWGDRPRQGTKACWWRRIGGRWERGCPQRDEPTIKEQP